MITETLNGTWDTYNPVADYTGGYHDAFAGPSRGNAGGLLYAVTREHRRSAVFGNTDSLILLRYDFATSNGNRQVIEGPFAGSGKIFTELGLAPDPLADLIIVGHFYEGNDGQLCRWSAPDQDQDGLPDAYEPTTGTLIDQADTDLDGMSDGYEVLVNGTDPLVSNLPPPRCDDGLFNGAETDVDCGGGLCPPCGLGQGCEQDTRDCSINNPDLVCEAGICVLANCHDGRFNQDETDVDCGGLLCDPCPDGRGCTIDQDCAENSCIGSICLNPDCTDSTTNQDETDVDCGGATCDPCQEGERCDVDTDCLNADCVVGVCVVPTCDDDRRNQDETDVDCGGARCAPCPRGSLCEVDTDCKIGLCLAGLCLISRCEDGRRNQDETDVDCGGSTCDPCLAGSRCDQDSDCLNEQCLRNTCVTPSCQDGVQNLDESDIDCGGTLCPRCLPEQRCQVNADCLSRICFTSEFGRICSTSSCVDGTQNADESDVDCGGSECAPCIDHRVCVQDTDCESGRCRGQRCQMSRCDDVLRNGDETDEDCGGSCDPCSNGQLCDDDQDCISSHCLGGRCAPPSCEDLRLNQGETEIDCGGPCAPCVVISVDQGMIEQDMFTMDMTVLVDADLPMVDSMIEDASIIDMEGPGDMWIAQDQEVIIFDQFADQSSPMSDDLGGPNTDQGQGLHIPDQDTQRINLDQFGSSPDMYADDEAQVDRGQTGPVSTDPNSGYDPQVFRRDRPKSGCQSYAPHLTSSSHSHLLLLLVLICYAFSRRVLLREDVYE